MIRRFAFTIKYVYRPKVWIWLPSSVVVRFWPDLLNILVKSAEMFHKFRKIIYHLIYAEDAA